MLDVVDLTKKYVRHTCMFIYIWFGLFNNSFLRMGKGLETCNYLTCIRIVYIHTWLTIRLLMLRNVLIPKFWVGFPKFSFVLSLCWLFPAIQWTFVWIYNLMYWDCLKPFLSLFQRGLIWIAQTSLANIFFEKLHLVDSMSLQQLNIWICKMWDL